VNFGTENWTHAFAQNGPTQVTIAIVAWDMRSRQMLLWKIILAAAALKGRKACAQPADARVREIGKQALSGPFAGMEASLMEVSYPPGGRSAEHRHPGFIVGYALEGKSVSQSITRLHADYEEARCSTNLRARSIPHPRMRRMLRLLRGTAHGKTAGSHSKEHQRQSLPLWPAHLLAGPRS
jgi:hypothetical protein